MAEWIDKGWDVVALVPSCALMLKFEWPLIEPGDEAVQRLARATFDVTEYVVDIARKEGLAEGLKPLDGKVALHIACHARAQNMGQKGAELLRLIPGAQVGVTERCSGHGGAWGVKKGQFRDGPEGGEGRRPAGWRRGRELCGVGVPAGAGASRAGRGGPGQGRQSA